MNIDQSHTSRSRKILYFTVATLLAVLLLWLVVVVLRLMIASEAWVKLIRNVDHRMTHEKFSDINSDGIRSPLEVDTIDENDFNVIFLGDSFIHGFILQYKLAPPKQLEGKLREYFNRDDVNVWNFGWTTSSPILQYRLLKDLGQKYRPNLVILSLDMTDYKDDYFYKSLIEGKGVYGWINRYPRLMYIVKELTGALDPYISWHKTLFGYSAEKAYFVASEPLEANRILFDTVLQSLDLINAYCRDELQVPFVVFIPPRHWQYTDKESPNSWDKGSYDVMGPYALENYHYFDQVRSSRDYPLVSLLNEFKSSGVYPTTFDKDSHWNKSGAQLMSNQVFQYLLKNGFLSELEITSSRNHGD